MKEKEEPKQKSPFNPSVQVLDLQKCGLQDLGFLNGLENLRVLGLGFNELEEQQLFQLESCRKLEVLTFVGNRTSEKVFGIARKLFKNLKEAYLTSTENQIELVMNAEEEK